MTAGSQYQFALELDTDADAPKLVVSDTSNPDAVITYTQPLPRSGLPYTLMLWHPPQSPDALTIVPADTLIHQLLTNWDETVKEAIGAGTSGDVDAPVTMPNDTTTGSPEPKNGKPLSAAPPLAVPGNSSHISAAPTTTGPKYWLELSLDTSAKTPVLTVKDTTNPQSVTTSTVQLPGSKPPYVLNLAPSSQSADTLTITPQSPGASFDPNVTSGRNVLDFSASISDRRLTTRDDTRYTVNLKNVSQYYLAEDIEVRLALSPVTRLLDGTDPLVIIPTEQRVRCIEPGAQHDVIFSVITRGIRPGAYPLRVHLTYRIVYWDGRQTSTTYSQMLSVQP